MNIFFCCFQTGSRYAIPAYEFWSHNLKPSLEGMGHRVIEPEGIDLVAPLAHRADTHWIQQYRTATSEELVRQVKAAHQKAGVDLFFSYFYSAHVFPDAIREIRRLGIPAVNFFCDNLREFHSISDLIGDYTLNWVPEMEARELYRQRRAPYIHLPMAANPALYNARPVSDIPQVTFVGSADGLRTRLLEEVFPSGLPLEVYGHGWVPGESGTGGPRDVSAKLRGMIRRRRLSLRQHAQRLRLHGVAGEIRYLQRRGMGLERLQSFKHSLHPGVPFDELLYLGANSAVLLGINRCPHPGYPLKSPLVYSRLRDLEGPMMGAAYLTEYCADVEALYDIGKEVLVYRNAEELGSEAQRLLKDENLRKRLRHNGRQAALSRHTWQHRFERLFSVLGLETSSAAKPVAACSRLSSV